MDSGGTDLSHPPLPFAQWGGGGRVVHIVRGQRTPRAQIPCDFVFSGCRAARGLALFAQTRSIPFHPCLAYISFPHQRVQSTSSGAHYRGSFSATSFMILRWVSPSIFFSPDLVIFASTKPLHQRTIVERFYGNKTKMCEMIKEH